MNPFTSKHESPVKNVSPPPVKMQESLFPENLSKIGQWQTIFGNVPSKSNSYKIITIKKKAEPGQSEADRKAFHKLGGTKQLRAYEKGFILQCTKYRNANINEEFIFEINAYYERKASDLDGCFKVVLDLLQEVGAIENDNLCVKIIAEKFIDKIDPRIQFRIIPTRCVATLVEQKKGEISI